MITEDIRRSIQPIPNNGEDSIGLLWSGGVDSTFMLYYLLSSGYNVNTYYVNIKNNEFKSERELAARNAIKSVLNDKYGYHFTDRSDTLDILYHGSNAMKLPQPLAWLSSTMTIHDRYLVMSYIMNDDAVSFIEPIRNIVNSLNAFRHQDLNVLFPLIRLSKSELWRSLPSDIRDLTTSCEYPESWKTDGICECKPCTKMREIRGSL